MIDPKLNELQDNSKAGTRNVSSTGLEEPENPRSTERPRAGLSVNDTIAADASLSVGGRGADTSGVRAGAGAGAGGTHLSVASSNRPPAVSRDETLSHDEIAAHAYRCWHERGCPEGSPEEDWHRAERELRERRAEKSLSAGA